MTSQSSMVLKNSKLHIAVIGDVHTGHPKTPTTHILSNLRRTFPNNEKTGDIDLFIVEGDFFDRQLNLDDPNATAIEVWVGDFLRMCKERDIVVRVLRGTPSHDWNQEYVFQKVNDISRIGCDLKYVDELYIEHIERFGIDVLYIPDEWRVRCEDTWNDVVAALAAKNLTQVDYVVMHGTFPHQMPKNTHHKLDMHDPVKYLSITKKYIFVGHIHFHSIWERIIAAGSFDRISHGEENPKGHIRVLVRDNEEDIIEFIPNNGAMKYITIDCSGVSVDDFMSTIQKKIQSLPDGSHVRIKARKGDVGMSSKDHLEKVYSQFQWTVKENDDGKETEKTVLVDTRKLHKTININETNIVSLMMERIQQKYPTVDLQRTQHALEELTRG